MTTQRKIKLRRTLASGPPADLAFGEVAYSDADERLHVGRADGSATTFGGDTDLSPITESIAALATETQAALALKAPLTVTQGTIAYGASVNLDMATLTGTHRTIALTGNLTLTSGNRGSGRQVVLRLICDATQRALSFPAGWRFLGARPANIAASKVGVLSLTFFGDNETDGVAAWGVEA